MNDDDITAFTPAPAAQPPRAARRRRVWLWAVMGAALLMAVLVVAGAATLLALAQSLRDGLDIAVDGNPLAFLHSDPDLGLFSVLGLVAAVMVVVPVVLILVLLAVVLSLCLALLAVVGAGVLAACCVLLVVALVLSPLWGAMLLLWLLLRPRPNRVPAHVAA